MTPIVSSRIWPHEHFSFFLDVAGVDDRSLGIGDAPLRSELRHLADRFAKHLDLAFLAKVSETDLVQRQAGERYSISFQKIMSGQNSGSPIRVLKNVGKHEIRINIDRRVNDCAVF